MLEFQGDIDDYKKELEFNAKQARLRGDMNGIEAKSKPDCPGWWIHEKYDQYKIYYIHIEALDSSLCTSGGRWYLWRDNVSEITLWR